MVQVMAPAMVVGVLEWVAALTAELSVFGFPFSLSSMLLSSLEI